MELSQRSAHEPWGYKLAEVVQKAFIPPLRTHSSFVSVMFVECNLIISLIISIINGCMLYYWEF